MTLSASTPPMTSAVTSTSARTNQKARLPWDWSISGGSGMTRCLSLAPPGAGLAVSMAGASAEPVGYPGSPGSGRGRSPAASSGAVDIGSSGGVIRCVSSENVDVQLGAEGYHRDVTRPSRVRPQRRSRVGAT